MKIIMLTAGLFCFTATIMGCEKYNFKTSNTERAIKDFLYGSTSGAAGMVVYTPFHYWQNRKIQNLPVILRHCLRGLPTLAVGKMPASGTRILIHDSIDRTFPHIDNKLSILQEATASTAAGAASGAINNITHLIALWQENHGKSVKETVHNLHQGKKSFSRSLGTSMARDMLFCNMYWIFLKQMKEKIQENISSPFCALPATYVACGSVITGLTQPFMVINAHLYADKERKKYKNGMHVAREIVKQHGVKGLYTAWYARYPGVILGFGIFDQLTELSQKY